MDCSFCCKSQKDREYLIAGSTTKAICDFCVHKIALRILHSNDTEMIHQTNRCSFCGKQSQYYRKLDVDFSGEAKICTHCLQMSAKLLFRRRRNQTDRLLANQLKVYQS